MHVCMGVYVCVMPMSASSFNSSPSQYRYADLAAQDTHDVLTNFLDLKAAYKLQPYGRWLDWGGGEGGSARGTLMHLVGYSVHTAVYVVVLQDISRQLKGFCKIQITVWVQNVHTYAHSMLLAMANLVCCLHLSPPHWCYGTAAGDSRNHSSFYQRQVC